MSLISSVDTSPKHVQAVYLPAWIVDAETETNAWFGDSAEVRRSLSPSLNMKLMKRLANSYCPAG